MWSLFCSVQSFFIIIVFFLVQAQYACDSSNLNLRICCHGYDIITTSKGSTFIHHSTNSEIAILWFYLKHNRTLKSYPNRKEYINYRLLFCEHNGTLLSLDLTLDY